MVLRENLCRNRGVGEGDRRSIDRLHSRCPFCRACRPGAGEYLRTGDALWHHREPDPGKCLRLSDVLLRPQAHAPPRLAALRGAMESKANRHFLFRAVSSMVMT